MNKITALSLLKITEHPTQTILVIADNKSVIKEVYTALKQVGWKDTISGYTKDRLVLKTGGELHVVLNSQMPDCICGMNPDLVLYEGHQQDLSIDEKVSLIPICSMLKPTPVVKKIQEELSFPPDNRWFGGEFGRLIFTEYD